MKNAFNKKVRSRKFHEGDLVLKKVFHAVKDNRGKWAPNYKGPFVVKKAFFLEGLWCSPTWMARSYLHP